MTTWLAFFLLSLIWGSSYLFIRIGDEQLTPLALVALRLFIGAVVLGAIAATRRLDLRLSRRTLLLLLVIATLNTAVPFLLIAWGETTVPSGLASVLNSTVPIFSVLIAGAALHDEPVTPARLAGVAVGFLGVVLLLSRDLGKAGVHWSGVISQGAIVVAALCYAAMAVYTRRTMRDVPSMTLATYILFIAGAETVLLSLILSPPPLTALHPKTLFSVVWLGALGSAVAYILAYFILANWGAARYTLVAYMLPVVGLSLGAIFLHETLDWRMLAGSALVILGVVLASLVRRRPAEPEALPSEPPAQASAAP